MSIKDELEALHDTTTEPLDQQVHPSVWREWKDFIEEELGEGNPARNAQRQVFLRFCYLHSLLNGTWCRSRGGSLRFTLKTLEDALEDYLSAMDHFREARSLTE